jgi:FKBP-type peptidyl-prolyl cis-trans isomerase FkpA
MRTILIAAFILFFISCSDEPKKSPPMDRLKIQESLLEANKRAITEEAIQIEDYIQLKGITASKTQTGLRYQIFKDVEGESIKKGQLAVVKYTVTLLNGKECYSTKDKVEDFIVAKDYVETGLHEGIQLMSVGDQAILILPSHLAHGLAGDLKEIPFRSTIVYNIELVAIK